VTVAKRKSSDTVARKTFSVSRLAEFASIPELIKATGQPVENWALVVVKELADNAADEAEEAGVLPVIEITVEADAITVSDQGRGIKPAVVKALVDYATKTSSRAAVVAPSRGQQGNALQSIIAMGHALAPSADSAVVIESQGVAHTIRFTIDPVRQTPVINRDAAPSAVKIGARVTVQWPDSPRSSIAAAKDGFFSLAEAYG
jgi:DNA topoisomerase VI subunit B